MISYTTRPRRSTGADEGLPAEFDAAGHPILSRHWFGVEPFRSTGKVAAEVVADLRRRRKVQQFYRLGDRVLGEFLAELGAERGITTIIDRKLDRYAELDPKALDAAGGYGFWQPPLHGVDP